MHVLPAENHPIQIKLKTNTTINGKSETCFIRTQFFIHVIYIYIYITYIYIYSYMCISFIMHLQPWRKHCMYVHTNRGKHVYSIAYKSALHYTSIVISEYGSVALCVFRVHYTLYSDRWKAHRADYNCSRPSSQGLYSQSGRTPYHKISWSLETARFRFRLFRSLWNL